MAWLPFVHSTIAHVARRLLRFSLGCVVAILLLFILPGCGAPVIKYFGPTLDSPYVTRVCIRQPKVPENQRFWGVTDTGKLVLEDWELALYQEHGRSIFYFDPDAPPESAGRLPIPYHTLECPERVLSIAPVLPRKPAAVAKKPEQKEENASKKVEAKAEAKPPPPPQQQSAKPPERQESPRVASKGCAELSEPGQTRSRGGKTRTCVRTRLLIHRGAEEDPPPQAMAAVKPREPKPVPQRVPEEYEDWGLSEPDTSGLDPDRAKECLGGVCHARHKNFKPKGKMPAEPGYAQTRAGEGGAPAKGTRTTVKTRKSPLSRPNNGVTKEGAQTPASAPQPAPKTTVKTTTKPVASGSGSAPNAGTTGKGPVNGETPETKAGRQVHKDWDPGPGFKKEVRLPSGKRPDAVNYNTKQVKELKPDNQRAIKRGEKQVEGYRKELEATDKDKGTWTGTVETYKGK